MSSALAGGGVALCSGTIHENTIIENSATDCGGGLAYCDGPIENNTIEGNFAGRGGGGLFRCSGPVRRNTISNNRTDRYGGGVSVSDGTIQYNTITGNSARGGGGVCGGEAMIRNNTIYGNAADKNGGGLNGRRAVIRDCIIWGNTAGASGSQVYESNTQSFCCIQGWTSGGEANFSHDPRFADEIAEKYHLRADSPCMDAGVNYYWFAWPQRDLNGNCRLVDNRVDIGCYEYGSWPFKIVRFEGLPGGETRLTWTSQPGDTYTIWSSSN